MKSGAQRERSLAKVKAGGFRETYCNSSIYINKVVKLK